MLLQRRPPRATRVTLAAILSLLAITCPLTVSAQTVAFGGPNSVSAPRNVVLFSGTASSIPTGQEADYEGQIQGIQAALVPDGAGNFTFSASVPIGPDAPLGGFRDAFPYIAFYTEPNRLALPIVVDRVKTFSWDERKAAGTDTSAASGQTERLAMQITKRGVDRLEPAYRSTLPLTFRVGQQRHALGCGIIRGLRRTTGAD